MKTKLIIAVALVLLIGASSAALLTYYAKITGTATIAQSITVDGENWDEEITYDITGVGGETFTHGPFTLRNNANVPTYVKFTTTTKFESSTIHDSVTTTYYSKINLENKDVDWKILSEDDVSGELIFNIVGNTFNWKLTAQGLQTTTNYVLIYYADFEDRYTKWGGNNLGAYIATITTDTAGAIDTSGSTNLGINLPTSPDWNMNDATDYFTLDDYSMRRGAKVWLVPASDYNTGEKKLTAWNPTTYLFETNLITYNDNDEVTFGLWMPALSEFKFWIQDEFNIASKPGTYTITTTVIPT